MLKKSVCAIILVMAFGTVCFARDDNKQHFINLCKNGTVEEFNRIIKNVGGPNVLLDDDCNTPIIIAAQWGMFGIVRRLVDMGADVNTADIFGRSALLWACFNDDLKIAQYLVDHGANMVATNVNGVRGTVLVRLYENFFKTKTYGKETLQTVKFLLNNGCSYTDQDEWTGNTFVHYLCGDFIDVSKMKEMYSMSPENFIKSLSIVNKKGLTPVDIAKHGRYSESPIVKFFNEIQGKEMLNPYD